MFKKFLFVVSQNLAHSEGSVCLFVSIKDDAHLITPNDQGKGCRAFAASSDRMERF